MVKKDKLKEIPEAGHRLALGMKLLKEVIFKQKQPSCKRKGAGSKETRVKKCEIKGGGQEMAVMVG